MDDMNGEEDYVRPNRLYDSYTKECIAIIIDISDYLSNSEIIESNSYHTVKLDIPTPNTTQITTWMVIFLTEEDLLYIKLSIPIQFSVIEYNDVVEVYEKLKRQEIYAHKEIWYE